MFEVIFEEIQIVFFVKRRYWTQILNLSKNFSSLENFVCADFFFSKLQKKICCKRINNGREKSRNFSFASKYHDV